MAVIETDGLSKYYGDVRGVEDLTFGVEEGEVFGFLGPNGAGKTTTIRTLMGFLSPTGGSATVLGADVRDAGALRAARARIGYLPSDPGLNENVTGRRLIEYHGALRGDVRSDELLELFEPPLDRKVGEYSRGNRQMLAIVLAFMHDPDLVIMDEPTSGLDPLKQERFLEFVRAERERGKTFFFSSHILGEVRKVCDRIGIVRDGFLVELEDVESLIDRTGKLVRASVGGTVTPEEFTIEGAHDVTVGGETTPDETATDGGEETLVTFTYTGAYEPLLRHLLRYDLRDLAIEEAPLEEVFMRFYGEDDAEAVVERVERERRAAEGEDTELEAADV
ncbi:ABC transporter ATP-binding protein [Halomarina rubra]|uniref:ABC transporter ATP-binding protein n=1 Tax=Halomarina rubra TaxID=2071873 RepID=A0ABD6AV33_9EURY|nr:ABC transporter ATP-binding protein [Halomarina rubra]